MVVFFFIFLFVFHCVCLFVFVFGFDLISMDRVKISFGYCHCVCCLCKNPSFPKYETGLFWGIILFERGLETIIVKVFIPGANKGNTSGGLVFSCFFGSSHSKNVRYQFRIKTSSAIIGDDVLYITINLNSIYAYSGIYLKTRLIETLFFWIRIRRIEFPIYRDSL